MRIRGLGKPHPRTGLTEVNCAENPLHIRDISKALTRSHSKDIVKIYCQCADCLQIVHADDAESHRCPASSQVLYCQGGKPFLDLHSMELHKNSECLSGKSTCLDQHQAKAFGLHDTDHNTFSPVAQRECPTCSGRLGHCDTTQASVEACKLYKCQHCYVLLDEHSSNNHIKMCHGSQFVFRCMSGYCPRKFCDTSDLLLHMRKGHQLEWLHPSHSDHHHSHPHSGPVLVQCSFPSCSDLFSTADGLMQHLAVGHGTYPFLHHKCGKPAIGDDWKSADLLRYKVKRQDLHTFAWQDLFPVSVCRLQHNTDRRCATCSCIFPTLEAMNIHAEKSYECLPFQCSKCAKSFANVKWLENHMACEQCPISNAGLHRCKFECGAEFLHRPECDIHERKSHDPLVQLEDQNTVIDLRRHTLYSTFCEEHRSHQSIKSESHSIGGRTTQHASQRSLKTKFPVDGLVQCRICRLFYKSSAMKAHYSLSCVYAHHAIACEVTGCNAEYVTAKDVISHYLEDHQKAWKLPMRVSTLMSDHSERHLGRMASSLLPQYDPKVPCSRCQVPDSGHFVCHRRRHDHFHDAVQITQPEFASALAAASKGHHFQSCERAPSVALICGIDGCEDSFMSATTGLIPHILKKHFVERFRKQFTVDSDPTSMIMGQWKHSKEDAELRKRDPQRALELHNLDLRRLIRDIEGDPTHPDVTTYSEQTLTAVFQSGLLDKPFQIRLSTHINCNKTLLPGPVYLLCSVHVWPKRDEYRTTNNSSQVL